MFEYIYAPAATKKWGVLCEDGRISGVAKFSRMWLIPKDASKPTDGRIKGRKEGNSK